MLKWGDRGLGKEDDWVLEGKENWFPMGSLPSKSEGKRYFKESRKNRFQINRSLTQ